MREFSRLVSLPRDPEKVTLNTIFLSSGDWCLSHQLSPVGPRRQRHSAGLCVRTWVKISWEGLARVLGYFFFLSHGGEGMGFRTVSPVSPQIWWNKDWHLTLNWDTVVSGLASDLCLEIQREMRSRALEAGFERVPQLWCSGTGQRERSVGTTRKRVLLGSSQAVCTSAGPSEGERRPNSEECWSWVTKWLTISWAEGLHLELGLKMQPCRPGSTEEAAQQRALKTAPKKEPLSPSATPESLLESLQP